MSPPTLFAPPLAGRRAGDAVALDPEEVVHLRSLRLRPGVEIGLTDGRGCRWIARLESVRRSDATCVLLRADPVSPGLPVCLAFGVAGKERTLWLIEKAVELGAEALQPVECARSRSVADMARAGRFWERARRRAIAALKQSGAGHLPEVRPVVALPEWLRDLGSEPASPRILADGDSRRRFSDCLAGWRGEPGATLLVGPEGGLEPHERAACREAGFTAGRLGRRTLRFETAGVAALAVVADHLAPLPNARQSAAGPDL